VLAQLAVSKVEVELRRHGAWRRSGGDAPKGLSWLRCGNIVPCACNERLRYSERKPLPASLLVG
jgi:hypothetical protein